MKKILGALLAAAMFVFGGSPSFAQTSTANGNIYATGMCVAQALSQGQAAVGVTTSGTFTGTLTVYGVGADGTTQTAQTPTITAAGNNVYSLSGFAQAKVCATAWTSGIASVYVFTSIAPVSGGGAGGSVTQGTTPWLVGGQGTAGAPATQVVTVQGIASGTSVPVSPALNSSGVAQPIICDSTAAISTSASGETQLVALASGKAIYVCSFSFQAAGAVNVNFASATAAACGGTVTALTGAYPQAANTGVSHSGGMSPALIVPAGDALCINLSAAIGVFGVLSYAQR